MKIVDLCHHHACTFFSQSEIIYQLGVLKSIFLHHFIVLAKCSVSCVTYEALPLMLDFVSVSGTSGPSVTPSICLLLLSCNQPLYLILKRRDA